MTKPRSRVLDWTSRSLFALPAQRGDLRLVVLVDPETRAVTAFETDRKAVTPEAALINHAHESVGVGESLLAALELAERYAANWVLKDSAAELCDCGPIAAGASR